MLLFDSHQGQKRKFVSMDPQRVQMYVCGPTVYSSPHIGNARPAVVFDVLYRVLMGQYPSVHYVRNLTDVDDKINHAAKMEGCSIEEISSRYTACYHRDVAALGCLPPSVEPRATEHISQMIAAIETLISRGHAYVSAGHVLFSVESYAQHGTLSGQNLQSTRAGARVAVADYKRNPADFVLWKPAEAHSPSWPSPWGKGRPGWHIECTAMIQEHCGFPIDIHGGGGDLLFPHHENEQAQGCCLSDDNKYCNYWVHNGLIHLAQEKMSKSLGNIVKVEELLARFPGEVVRLVFLQTHYRQPLAWRDDLLIPAQRLLNRMYRVLLRVSSVEMDTPCWDDVPVDIRAALCDDMNVPLALTLWQQLWKSSASKDDVSRDWVRAFRAINYYLGLGQVDPYVWFQYGID